MSNDQSSHLCHEPNGILSNENAPSCVSAENKFLLDESSGTESFIRNEHSGVRATNSTRSARSMPNKNNKNNFSKVVHYVNSLSFGYRTNKLSVCKNVANDPCSHSTSECVKPAVNGAGLRRRCGVRATASTTKEDRNSNNLLGRNLRANGNSSSNPAPPQAVCGNDAPRRQRPLQAARAAQSSVDVVRISNERFENAMREIDNISPTLHSIYTNGNSSSSTGLPSRNSLTPLIVSPEVRCGNSTLSLHPDSLGSHCDTVTQLTRTESYPHTLSSKQRCSEHSKRILEPPDTMHPVHEATTRTSEKHACTRVSIREDLNSIVHFNPLCNITCMYTYIFYYIYYITCMYTYIFYYIYTPKLWLAGDRGWSRTDLHIYIYSTYIYISLFRLPIYI